MWGDGLEAYLVKIHQDGALGALVLKQLLRQSVEAVHLVLGLLDNPLEGAQVGGRGTLVEQVDVDVFGDGVLAGGDGLEESTLSATVLAQQAVAAAKVELEGAVGDEDATVEDETGGGDLDVAAGRDGGQDAGGDAVGQAVLVHLVGEALDRVHLVGRGGGLVRLDRVAVGIELRLVAIYGAGLAGVLGAGLGPGRDRLLLLAVGGLLGQSLLLGC